MAYTLACKDAGVDCPHVARGETEQEVLKNGIEHVKEEHGYTDEQLNPEFLAEVKGLIKQAQLFLILQQKGQPIEYNGLASFFLGYFMRNIMKNGNKMN